MLKQILRSLSRTEKTALVASASILCLSVILRTASAVEEKTALLPKEGGEYHEGIVGQPAFVNPVIASGDADRDLAAVIYEELGNLTESIEADEDRKIFNLKLKENLVWQDGARITADDIVFTLEAIQDENVRSPLFQSWQGVIVERVSEIQARFILRTPYVFFEDSVRGLRIIPQHIFGEIPGSNLRLSAYNLEPVGSGPYQFEKFSKKKDGFVTEYHLTLNRGAVRRPLIKKIVFHFYKNEDERVNAFNNRAIDGLGGVDPENVDKLASRYDLATLPMSRYYAIFFNQNLKMDLKNVNLRLALAQTVDRGKIVNEVFRGLASAVEGPLAPGFPGYDENALHRIPYDPVSARDIVQKLNKDISLNLIVPEADFLVKTAEIIKSAWKELGLRVELIILRPNDIVNEVIRSRNYEAILFGNILQYNPDLTAFWHSKEKFYPGLNLALYSSPKADELLEAARAALNPDLRQQKISQLQSIITQDIPAVFLYSPKYLYVSRGLKGFDASYLVTPADRLKNIDEWYLKTKRVFKNI